MIAFALRFLVRSTRPGWVRFRLAWLTLFTVVLFGLLVVSSAAAPARGEAARRPRIALVLSGGAARGSAHVGVLKMLEELRVPVDFIAGTSMGAIVGGMYATGMSPDEMQRTLTSTDWQDLFTDRPSRNQLSYRRKQEDVASLFKFEMGWDHGLTFPASLVAGDKLIFFLRRLTLQAYDVTNFDRLSIPFRAIATDIESGDCVVLREGDLAQALRASMAIPGLFAPQPVEDRLLVDGFLSENLPVNVAREWGADVIIAVDVGMPLSPRSELKSMLHFTDQAIRLITRKNTAEQIALLRADDILIQPEMGALGSLQFERSAEAIESGEAATEQHRNALTRFALSEPDYATWQAQQRKTLAAAIRIDSVRVENHGRVADSTIEQRAGKVDGEEVKVGALRRILNRIYDLGAFDLVDFRVASGEQGNELSIHPRDRSAGPMRIRSGLTLFSDLDGESSFNFLTSVTATELNARGAEWTNQVQFGRTSRVFSEWYQPLDRGRAVFFAGNVEFLQERVEADNASGALFRAKYRSARVGADVGAQLGNFGELRVGPSWSRTNVYELVGTTLPGGITQATQAGLRARLMVDQFDDVNFPRSGYYGGLEIFASRRELGSEQNHNRTSAAWVQAKSFGRNTFVASGEFNAKLGPDLPFYETFGLGGFLNLSGYPFGGISDQYSGLARLIYYRRVGASGSKLLGSLYAGGSLESGGVWHRAGDIGTKGLIMAGSMFVGADTILGPFYLAYGQAERGNRAFYFYLGRGF